MRLVFPIRCHTWKNGAQKEPFSEVSAYDRAIQCSIAEYGDDSHCSEIYAFKRDIYERIKDWKNAKEMGNKFASAKKTYDETKEFSQKEYQDERLEKIHKGLERLGEQERKTSDELSSIVLLTIKDKYQGQDISYEKIGKIIDDILEEVDYDKDTRPIEKALLINRVSGQIQNDSK